jgi:hypothetical protein
MNDEDDVFNGFTSIVGWLMLTFMGICSIIGLAVVLAEIFQ